MGHLYPLEQAFYFVERPAMCILHSDVHTYELRPSGHNSIELVLHMRPPAKSRLEFTIQKSELGRLQTYLEKSTLKVRPSSRV